MLKRKPSEFNINNYNIPVLLAWQANMVLQCVLNDYRSFHALKTNDPQIFTKVSLQVVSHDLLAQQNSGLRSCMASTLQPSEI